MPDAMPLQANKNEPPNLALGVSADPAKPSRGRIDSIDLLRGIVMVIMMLDHTRDFIHSGALLFDPTDLSKTTTALFFTRWITHFCAPVFVFLAGTGAYLQFARGKNKRDLSRFLVTRGLWLIVLEFTAVRLGATFSFDPRFLVMLQVIWVIGVSMIVLAALIHLPLKVVAAFGLVMIALHNLLDRYQAQPWQGPGSPVPGWGAKLWMLLHQQAFFPIGGHFPSPMVFALYPLIPWIGVMAAGYAFGALYPKDSQLRKRWLLWIGVVATLLFTLLRAIDRYGEPFHWAREKNVGFTVMSFLNTTKYPPSLLFLLMTLGPAILLLLWFESSNRLLGAPPANPRSVSSRVRDFFVTFGRVPLFFYLLQWPTAHGISLLLHVLAGKPWRWLVSTPLDWQYQPGMGFNLVVVYVCWIAGVLLLYPLCKWFAGLKARRRDWWLSYL